MDLSGPLREIKEYRDRLIEARSQAKRYRWALIALRDGIDTKEAHCNPMPSFTSWRFIVDKALSEANVPEGQQSATSPDRSKHIGTVNPESPDSTSRGPGAE
jgi:hypothetical protein